MRRLKKWTQLKYFKRWCPHIHCLFPTQCTQVGQERWEKYIKMTAFSTYNRWMQLIAQWSSPTGLSFLNECSSQNLCQKSIPHFGGGWRSLHQKVIVASSNPRQASLWFSADRLHFCTTLLHFCRLWGLTYCVYTFIHSYIDKILNCQCCKIKNTYVIWGNEGLHTK